MEPSAYGINLWIDLPWTIEQLYHCLTWITKTDYEKLREDHNSLRMQKFHHRHTSLLIWSTSWWWWWSSSWRVKPGKFMTKHTGSNCHSHHHHHHHHHHNVGELRFVPVRGVDGWMGANWGEAASVAGRRWRRPDIPQPLLPSFAFFFVRTWILFSGHNHTEQNWKKRRWGRDLLTLRLWRWLQLFQC